jgi:hypothetical protein
VVLGQEEGLFRQTLGFWKLAYGHCDLVAGVAASAVHAVLDDFVAEGEAFGEMKVKVLEEGWDAGEETDALDAAGFGLVEEGADEEATGAVAFGLGMNGDGADLGEVLAVDVEGCAAEELMGVGFDDGEGADVGADLRVGATEEGAVVAEAFDELVDGVGVAQLRATGVHGACVEAGAGRDRARLRWSCSWGADRQREERGCCGGVGDGRECL